MDILQIICDYLNERYDDSDLIEDVMNYFNIDQLVGFFVEKVFNGDDDDLRDALGEEEASAVLEHYEAHC